MLQIALHAAAILVGVKRHNKPGWRMRSGVAGRRCRSWEGSGACGWWLGWACFGPVLNKEANARNMALLEANVGSYRWKLMLEANVRTAAPA